jgi:hypothetical protein
MKSYPNNSPFPVSFYEWECPVCGDVCSDPQDVYETECHNHHEVRLYLTDNGARTHMVAKLPKDAP